MFQPDSLDTDVYVLEFLEEGAVASTGNIDTRRCKISDI